MANRIAHPLPNRIAHPLANLLHRAGRYVIESIILLLRIILMLGVGKLSVGAVLSVCTALHQWELLAIISRIPLYLCYLFQ